MFTHKQVPLRLFGLPELTPICTAKPLLWLIKGQNLHKHQSEFAFTNFSVGFLNCFVCICRFHVCAFVKASACAYCISGLSTSMCLISNYCLWCPFADPLASLPCPHLFCTAAYHLKAWARDLAPRQTGLHENRQCCRFRVSEIYSSMHALMFCSSFFFAGVFSSAKLNIVVSINVFIFECAFCVVLKMCNTGGSASTWRLSTSSRCWWLCRCTVYSFVWF